MATGLERSRQILAAVELQNLRRYWSRKLLPGKHLTNVFRNNVAKTLLLTELAKMFLGYLLLKCLQVFVIIFICMTCSFLIYQLILNIVKFVHHFLFFVPYNWKDIKN